MRNFFGKNEVHFQEINEEWVIVGWDSAHPNGLFNASGNRKPYF